MNNIQQITLTNVGPIKYLEFPCPGPGDIIVLQGRNGTGKSTALAHAEIAMTGRGKGNIADGASAGQVDAFGITLKLGKSTRRSGTLEVEALEGKFNISDLIDPGYIDPKAADSCRIKAFAQIQKVLPSADLFYDLVGGREQLEKLVRPASLKSDDFVTMAERIKADLQEAAKREEDQAENAEGRATGAKEAARGVDLSAEADSEKLSAALNDAIRDEARITAEKAAAVKAAAAARLAQDQLDDAEAEYNGPTVAEAKHAEEAMKAGVESAERTVKELEAKLQEARQKAAVVRESYSSAIATRKNAEAHEASMKQWRAQVAAAVPVEPAPELLAAAKERVAAGHKACELGTQVRKAREQLAAAEQHVKTAGEHRKRAGELRDAAKGTDDVLSGIVARSGSQLRVEAGRLVLDTPKRGKTFFHELSAGERARIAVDIGIDAMPPGKPGVIIISQEIFEGLDCVNRDALKAHITERGVGILTAEAGWEDGVIPKTYGTEDYVKSQLPPNNFDPEFPADESNAVAIARAAGTSVGDLGPALQELNRN